jgi:hypothetical protein
MADSDFWPDLAGKFRLVRLSFLKCGPKLLKSAITILAAGSDAQDRLPTLEQNARLKTATAHAWSWI